MPTIEVARADDLPRILELLTVMHGESWDGHVGADAQRTFTAILAQPGRHVIVARIGDVVGTCDLLIIKNLSRGGRPWAMIENISVAPEYRRQGVATALLTEAMERASSSDCYKVQLVSHNRRSEAHALYGKLGSMLMSAASASICDFWLARSRGV